MSRINAEPCTGPGLDARWSSTSRARPTAGDVLDTAYSMSRIRDTIPGFSIPQWPPVRCAEITTEFDQGKESTVTSMTSTRAPRPRPPRHRAVLQGLAAGGRAADADEQPRPRGRRAPRGSRGLRRHRPGRPQLGGVRRDRADAARPGERRDHAGAVRQAGRRVPHPRVGAARADRELESRWRLGELGAVPQARGRGPDDVRADDRRLVDLHRHAGHPAGHLRDVRRGCEEEVRRTRWPARSPSPRASAAWAARSRWP